VSYGVSAAILNSL